MAHKLLRRKLKLLSGAAARQLFRKCAGREGLRDAGPGRLERQVIAACGGLPLALELAGGFLQEQGNKDVWQVCSVHSRGYGRCSSPVGHKHMPGATGAAAASSFEA